MCCTLAPDTRRLCGHFASSSSLISKFSAVSTLARSWKLLQRPVSSHVRSTLHLLATLENFSIPARLDALELGAVGEDAAEQHTRFNVGFDFATILSSPVPCCILFDIDPGQLAELNMLILNRWRRLFHSWRVKLPFVNMSASWFLVSTFLIWSPCWFCQLSYQSQLCGSGIRISLLDFCPWWSSWSLLRHLQKCKASHRNEKISR